MPNSLYFTTGQAAQQLNASQAQIRALCESGAVEAETTPGGHYRIPASELARLQRDGLPPIPRPLPDESRPAARNGRTGHGNPELLAEPSSEVVSAVEEVILVEADHLGIAGVPSRCQSASPDFSSRVPS